MSELQQVCCVCTFNTPMPRSKQLAQLGRLPTPAKVLEGRDSTSGQACRRKGSEACPKSK